MIFELIMPSCCDITLHLRRLFGGSETSQYNFQDPPDEDKMQHLAEN